MNLLKNKKILVTGGTGSLGKELVLHLLKNHEPGTVRIYDVDETEQFNFQQELRYYFKDNLKKYEDIVRFLLGDVRDWCEFIIHMQKEPKDIADAYKSNSGVFDIFNDIKRLLHVNKGDSS